MCIRDRANAKNLSDAVSAVVPGFDNDPIAEKKMQEVNGVQYSVYPCLLYTSVNCYDDFFVGDGTEYAGYRIEEQWTGNNCQSRHLAGYNERIHDSEIETGRYGVQAGYCFHII